MTLYKLASTLARIMITVMFALMAYGMVQAVMGIPFSESYIPILVVFAVQFHRSVRPNRG